MKPIIFNTYMVRAILEGRKTVTRRVIKNSNRTPTTVLRENFYKMVSKLNGKPYFGAGFYAQSDIFFDEKGEQHIDAEYFRCLYKPGDILYVRETWRKDVGRYMHKADYSDNEKFYRGGKEVAVKWHPSIHMPREAARIFLRVKGVRVERLQEITEEQGKAEGAPAAYPYKSYIDGFASLWDGAIKHRDRLKYGWKVNPWVWVIEFDRISKEEAYSHETQHP